MVGADWVAVATAFVAGLGLAASTRFTRSRRLFVRAVCFWLIVASVSVIHLTG